MKPDERYTWRACADGYTDTGLRKGITEGGAICQLADYEDTGLSPEEVKGIVAERLPCAIGEIWYVMASNCTRIAEVKIIAIFLSDDKSESRIIAETEDTNEKWIFSLDEFVGEASKNREGLEKLLSELRVRKNFNKLKEREENE